MHEEGVWPHTHKPTVIWDMKPSPIDSSGTP
jgi:hypothetical protein